jgi:hypothetical protein
MVAICWKVLEILGSGAQLEEIGHWGVSLKVIPAPQSLPCCLVLIGHEVKPPPPHAPATTMICLTMVPEPMESKNYGPKPLRL